MFNGIFHIRKPQNETVLSYAPGSRERADLVGVLKEMLKAPVEVPCIIGGRDVHTGDLVKMVAPHDHIRITKTDGTTLDRAITNVAEIDADEERISVDGNWPSNIAVADIERIEYLELVRLDSDRIRVAHHEVAGDATIDLPVRSVLT